MHLSLDFTFKSHRLNGLEADGAAQKFIHELRPVLRLNYEFLIVNERGINSSILPFSECKHGSEDYSLA